MKKSIFLALFFICLSVKSQIFAPLGASWYFNSQNNGAAPSNSEYIKFESIKDTLIKGQSVRKIERTCYHYIGTVSTLSDLFVYNSTDTAFIYNPMKDKFDKLYIFNKNKGDTITLDVPFEQSQPALSTNSQYRLVIDSVAVEIYNGKTLKKYKTRGLDNFQFWSEGWFMDYAGGIDWFFPSAAIISEADGPLRCYNAPEFNIHFSEIDCDYRLISAVVDVKNAELQIYPNPAIDEFQISGSTEIVNVEIYNNKGILNRKEENSTFYISELPKGIYIVKIKLLNNSILFKKLIKN